MSSRCWQAMNQHLEGLGLDVERLGEARRFNAQLQVERAETLRILQQGAPRASDAR